MNKRSGMKSKERITRAAMDVFLRKGYAKASIREIARSAGLSVGAVYLYFRNKEELYKNLILEKMRDLESRTARLFETIGSAPEALSGILGMHLEHAIKHREFILLHIREHGFTFGAQEKRKFFEHQKEMVENIIRRGILSGEFRKCNPGDMATMIMGTLRGVVLSMALERNVFVSPRLMQDFVLRGLLSESRRE